MAVDLTDDGTWMTATFSGTITGADLDGVIRQVIEMEGRKDVSPDR